MLIPLPFSIFAPVPTLSSLTFSIFFPLLTLSSLLSLTSSSLSPLSLPFSILQLDPRSDSVYKGGGRGDDRWVSGTTYSRTFYLYLVRQGQSINQSVGHSVSHWEIVYLSVCLSVCLSTCLSVCNTECRSVRQSICLSVSLSACQSVSTECDYRSAVSC